MKKIKSKNISTKDFYHKIAYNTRQFAIKKYDKDHHDYMNYIEDFPTTHGNQGKYNNLHQVLCLILFILKMVILNNIYFFYPKTK